MPFITKDTKHHRIRKCRYWGFGLLTWALLGPPAVRAQSSCTASNLQSGGRVFLSFLEYEYTSPVYSLCGPQFNFSTTVTIGPSPSDAHPWDASIWLAVNLTGGVDNGYPGAKFGTIKGSQGGTGTFSGSGSAPLYYYYHYGTSQMNAYIRVTVMFTCPDKACGSNTPGVQIVALSSTSSGARPCEITSVKWEDLNPQITTAAPLSSNPSYAGGGNRIFAEKDEPSGDVRNEVAVRAKTNDPGRRIFLSAYDVADASPFPAKSRSSPGPREYDNYGALESSSAGKLTPYDPYNADEQSEGVVVGIAGFEGYNNTDYLARFATTFQPGDNFRIAAACSAEDLASVKLTNGQLQHNGKVVVSDMLTVWRRLHIEVDKMEPVPPTANQTAAVLLAPIIFQGSTTLLFVRLQNPLQIFLFEGGMLISGADRYPIRRSFCRWNSPNVCTPVLEVEGAAARLRVGAAVTLVDDDDVAQRGVLDGDAGISIPNPDLSLLADSDDPSVNAFAKAMIRPAYSLVSRPCGIAPCNATPLVPFQLHPGCSNRDTCFQALTRFDNLVNDPHFWVVNLLAAYQHVADFSGDPDLDQPQPYPYSATDLATIRSSPVVSAETDNFGGTVAVVFMEVLRDLNNQIVRGFPRVIPRPDLASASAATVAHEVGHLLGGRHSLINPIQPESGTPDPGLMSSPLDRVNNSFSANSIEWFRRFVGRGSSWLFGH